MTLSEMVEQERERVKASNQLVDVVVSFYQNELKKIGLVSSTKVDSYYPNYSVKISFGDDAFVIVSPKHIFTCHNSFSHNETSAVLRDIAQIIAERNIHAITVGSKKA